MADYGPWLAGVTSRSGHGLGAAGMQLEVNARSEPEAARVAVREFRRATGFHGLVVSVARVGRRS